MAQNYMGFIMHDGEHNIFDGSEHTLHLPLSVLEALDCEPIDTSASMFQQPPRRHKPRKQRDK